ncbi:MAG TPA: hypothetical protein VGR69_09445 [Candidatus Rubrimentiphilum sp.]|nr:hypothetical protein [Candidatus Rubrimentiphilum sp.]
MILRLLVERDLTSGYDLSQCAVLSVVYADGTSWQNPKPPI